MRELIEHRKQTGLLTGDVDEYCKRIVESVRERKNNGFYVPAADGRTVFARNEALPAGGWVSTA